jgi:hypothetical protein
MKSKTALQVGVSYYKNSKGNKIPYSYRHVKPKQDGWVDPKEWLPFSFDLVFLQLKDKVKIGWYTGGRWDGKKVEPSDKVIAWKRKMDEDEE